MQIWVMKIKALEEVFIPMKCGAKAKFLFLVSVGSIVGQTFYIQP